MRKILFISCLVPPPAWRLTAAYAAGNIPQAASYVSFLSPSSIFTSIVLPSLHQASGKDDLEVLKS
jgi:hypothetical protein